MQNSQIVGDNAQQPKNADFIRHGAAPLLRIPASDFEPRQLVGIDLAGRRLPHHTSTGIPLEEKFPAHRDSARKFERSAIQDEQVDTGGQNNLESFRCLFVEIGGDVDIGIRTGSARRATAMKVGKDGAAVPQRLYCFLNSLVHPVHRRIISSDKGP